MDDIKAGVYRHYKGPLYLVMGLAHDANAGSLYNAQDVEDARRAWQSGVMHEIKPIGARDLVVYIGLQLDDAHTGPRLAVRTADNATADWFFELVCWNVHCRRYGTAGEHPVYGTCSLCTMRLRPRFEYVGPTWEGE